MQPKTSKTWLTAGALSVALLGTGLTTACTQRHVEGGLIGGAAVGGAYEYYNKRSVDRLERQRANGQISRREYQRRRQEIDDRSLFY